MAERLSLAYVHYGEQSGVTGSVARALAGRGHDLRLVGATGPLDLRDPATRLPRLRVPVAVHLALSVAHHGRRWYQHRWNTPYAFDVHSRRAGELLAALRPAPDVVLQNGALLSPGLPPRLPYTLLLDHTRALAMRSPPFPRLGLEAPLDYGTGWRARETAVYRGASAIATFSRNVARSLVEDYGVAEARIAVVGAGANVFPDEAPRLDDGRTVLFVGKDFARKGGPVLLDAFVRLRRWIPKARLLIAGPREAPPLPEGATWLGPVDLDELPSLCAQASVFCLPTLREPYGLAYLDAMACGLPCVGTRIEAVPEIVAEGETGLLAPPGDPVLLAEALCELLSDVSRARELGARGRARVAAGHRWEHVAERLEAVLRRTRAGGAAGSGRVVGSRFPRSRAGAEGAPV